jgi:hypothetical protein
MCTDLTCFSQPAHTCNQQILDEETKTVNGSASRFLKRTLTNFQRDPEQARLLRKPMANKRQSIRLRSGDVGKEEELTSFSVVHYPGTVNYSVVKFLDAVSGQ